MYALCKGCVCVEYEVCMYCVVGVYVLCMRYVCVEYEV